MLSAEEQIQKTVVSLEAGELAKWVLRAIFAAVAIGLSVYYMVHEFRGLPMSQSMDQAQIGREILRGHGWQTKVIRPLAIGELRSRGKDLRTAVRYDTYNAPIPPLLDAAALYIPITKGWDLTKTEPVYSGDRAIAIMGVIFFLGALLALYYIALDLFDQRLACMAVGLVMICDMMWRYSLSGLPQTFLLLLFHLNVLAVLRAMRARYLNEPYLWWVVAAGIGFALMALTHALTIFIFFPVLVFAFVFFRPRAGFILLAVFLAVYTPWLVRTWMVCGDFRGVAGVAALDGIVHSESGHMRRFAIDLGTTSGNYYAQNFRVNLVAQINRLIEYMGWSFVAPLALVSVLHPFRRPVTSAFRWLMFAMWTGAVCGMAVFGMKEEQGLAANQFHVLFVPLFICYGMAYVLVQWDRRIGLGFILPQWGDRSGVHYFLRRSLVIGVFLVSGVPLLSRIFLERNVWSIEWPPYTPTYIALLHDWTQPHEIIGTDMPWAVAWYADRPALWLPYDSAQLADLSDYQRLGGPVAMLYFTPISGTMNTLGDLVTGEYSKWTSYIVRTVDLTKSPYPVKISLGMRECVLYMDWDRRNPVPK